MPFSLTKKQEELWKTIQRNDDSLIYGGSGSGKTYGVIAWLVCNAIATECRQIILRTEHSTLKQSIGTETMPEVLDALELIEGTHYEINNTYLTYTFATGSIIQTGGTHDKRLLERLLGRGFLNAYLNEAPNMNYTAFEIVKTRQRQKHDTLKPKTITDLNPVGKSHWTYCHFIEGKNFETGEPLQGNAKRGFLQMNPQHNQENLPDGYIETTLASLSGAKRRRFLEGEYADNIEGALLINDDIHYKDIKDLALSNLTYAIGLDPAGREKQENSQTGIFVAAKEKYEKIGYAVEDATEWYRPGDWADKAISLSKKYKNAPIIIETNYGGAAMEYMIKGKSPTTPVVGVVSRGNKVQEFEPIAELYRQKQIYHIAPLPHYKNQVLSLAPKIVEDGSIRQIKLDRVDAARHAFNYLFNIKAGKQHYSIRGQ